MIRWVSGVNTGTGSMDWIRIKSLYLIDRTRLVRCFFVGLVCWSCGGSSLASCGDSCCCCCCCCRVATEGAELKGVDVQDNRGRLLLDLVTDDIWEV